MKSTIIVLFTFLALASYAQPAIDSAKLIKPVVNKTNQQIKTNPPVQKTVTGPVSGSQTAGQTKTTSTLTDADYFLSGAVIIVSTGTDNKEPNTSTVSFYLRPRKSNGNVAYHLPGYANELPVNQTTELRLDRKTTLTAAQNSLQYFKQNGLSVLVEYCNKTYCTDAWKINNITIRLEFKDANGGAAPGEYASKTIRFAVSSGTLGFIPGCNPFWVTDGKSCGFSDQLTRMLLKTDEYFNPLPAALLKWNGDDVN